MAGFFGMFNYAKPGKGVRKDEPQHSHFVKYFVLIRRKFLELIQLNLLFLLFCLPIVTIGPAMAGFTHVLRSYANEQPVFMFSDFWENFKSNFKQSFVLGLLSLFLSTMLVMGISFYFTNGAENSLMYLPAGILVAIFILFLFANFYIPLMIVTLELPMKNIIKNSVIFAVLGMKSNIFTLLVLALILFFAWFFEGFSLLFFVIIGFSLIGLLIVHNSYRVLKKYAIDPYYAALEGKDGDDDGDDDSDYDDYDDYDEEEEENTLFLDEFSAPQDENDD